MLCQVNIVVGITFSLPTGEYATYINSKGATAWTKNFGYNPGDVVEVFHDRKGKPDKIITNGIEKQISA